MNLFQELGKIGRYKGPLVGIEIEVEAKNPLRDYRKTDLHGDLINNPPNNWSFVKDGSLRGHCGEFVSTVPKKISELIHEGLPAIKNELLVDGQEIFSCSPRVSTHVHINVSDLSYVQIMTLCSLWWSLENTLVKWCGPTRVGNNFCLRIKDATRQVANAMHSVLLYFSEDGGGANYSLGKFCAEDSKYMALNLSRLKDIGTLEFRSFGGLDFDKDDFKLWLEQIEHLYLSALKLSSPQDVAHEIDTLGYDLFAKKYLLPSFLKVFEKQHIVENEPMVLAISYSVNKWKVKRAKKTPRYHSDELGFIE